MSFSDEFKKMRAQGAPKVTPEIDKETQEAAASKDAAAPPSEDPDAAQYGEPLKDGQVVAGAPEVQPDVVIPPPKEEPKKVPIKIKGKTFESVEEAMAYAEAELNEVEKDKAYLKGKEDALKPAEPVKPAEKKKILKIAEKLFENPDEAMEELEAHFAEMADRRAEAREAVKTEAQIKAEATAKAVEDFYKANADLAEWQDEVNMVVERNNAYLKTLPQDKIAAEAARLSREYVASVKEKALPRQTLPSKPAITPAGGFKSNTATNKPATENKVSFAQQVRSTNKRTVMQDEA
jgi:hypothetical protein